MIAKALKSVFCEPPYPKCDEETMVEVVRCKDCIKWTKLYSDAEFGWCKYHSEFNLESTRFDDYCSRGGGVARFVDSNVQRGFRLAPTVARIREEKVMELNIAIAIMGFLIGVLVGEHVGKLERREE